MSDVPILTEAELRELVPLDLQAVDAVEQCFRALASEGVVMPPVMRLDIPEHNGEVDVKTAYLPGAEGFAIKISPGFFDNPKLGLPSLNGLMVLLSSETGMLKALLLDNGYLTSVRTAAAGAVAARWLAREDSRVAGIIGTGEQARLQLEALTLVRPIESAIVWGRRRSEAERYAREMSALLRIEVSVAESAQDAVGAADVVITSTPSSEPLLRWEWLRPGVHVTAMGSDAEHKNELHPSVVALADLYVCDRLSQCRVLGELRHALEADAVDEQADFPELGQIIGSLVPGRSSPEQITVCDLTGTGAQDTAIATLAFARSQAAGGGIGSRAGKHDGGTTGDTSGNTADNPANERTGVTRE